MAILWAGGEDIDYNNALVSVAGGSFRAGYARCSLSHDTIGNTMRQAVPLATPVTSCWMSMQVAGTNVATSVRMFGLMRSGTSSGLFVGSSAAADTKMALITFDGSTAVELAAEGGNSWASSVTGKLDVQVTNYGATAAVNVYWNGTLAIAFTGDVTVSGMTDIDQTAQCGNSGSTSTTVSEVMLADQDTRLWSLVTLAPTGPGTLDQWTGAYTDVNEIVINDSTVVSTSALGLTEEFVMNALPAGTFTVLGVKAVARATLSGAGALLSLGIDSGGNVNQVPQTLTGSFATYENLILVDPGTSAPFTLAAINALQLYLLSSD